MTTEGGWANPDVYFPTFHGSKFAREDEAAALTVAKEESKHIADQAIEYARIGKYPLGLKALQVKQDEVKQDEPAIGSASSTSSKKASVTTTQLAQLPELMKKSLAKKTELEASSSSSSVELEQLALTSELA